MFPRALTSFCKEVKAGLMLFCGVGKNGTAVSVTFVLALRQLRLKSIPQLIILHLTQILTSSGMHLNLPSKKHVGLPRQLAHCTLDTSPPLLQEKHLLSLAK